MEKGKSSNVGSARCRFKRVRRVETKVEIKRRRQRQATCGCQCLNDVFWILVLANAANVSCSLLNGESADVPEDICSGLVAAFRAVCNGYRYTPKAIFSMDDTVMHCRVWIRVLRSARYIIVKSLADDHPFYTTTPM